MDIKWYENNKIAVEDSIGIDEVGRGPLAGPVVSAAVWLSLDCYKNMCNHNLVVKDSKKMTQKQREKVIEWISKQSIESIRYAIGFCSVEEIDKINILNASLFSMKKAYEALNLRKATILIDGNAVPDIRDDDNCLDVRTIIQGDSKVFSISVASIIAKEYRDNIMRKLDCDFPEYGWKTNVGYGSKVHLEAIYKHGITCHHRKSFSPIKEMV